MKKLFTVILLILFGASVYTYLQLPEIGQDVPHLRWVVKASEIKNEQIVMFKEWLEENDYPKIEITLDPADPKTTKNIVQGISGVAGDILDCYEEQVQLYQSVGLLSDISDIASEMGFDPSKTYPSVRNSMMVNGRQYAFPRNVGVLFLWVNAGAFEKIGLSPPPDKWTFQEFEEIGTAYIKKANLPDKRQTTYFYPSPSFHQRLIYLRSIGGDIYNETMTKSGLDSPLFEEIYEMIYRWIFELHITPTAEEAKTLSSATESGTAGMNLFAEGNYGLLQGSRWGLMIFREIGPKQIAVSEFPHDGFRNTIIYYGACAIYQGSKQKDVAPYFLKFLTSERFNRHIVESGDSLPPIPKYAETEEFLRPSKYPNEWGVHGRVKDMAKEISLPVSSSPYILWQNVIRIEKKEFQKFIANRNSARESLQTLANTINNEILRKVSEDPELAKRYEQELKNQGEIDQLRAEGKLVPLYLITNPFYRKYYVEKGWSLPEGSSELASIE